jgi:transformation/transcription domain-associated protein
VTVINNMYGYNAMEVQEAFVKIKEQARAYLALPNDLQAGELIRVGIPRFRG